MAATRPLRPLTLLSPPLRVTSHLSRWHLLHCSSRSFRQKAEGSRVPDFAFAFDIDGVLVRSARALPRASKALAALRARRVPFILLTNGGGRPEAERVATLSERLGVPLDETMFVQSHTPYARFVPQLRDEPILVLGGEGERCRKVAETYGFTNVIIPSDIYHAHPDIWPFSAPFAAYHAAAAKPLPRPVYDPKTSPGKHGTTSNLAEALRINTMFVYNDPRDQGLDLQLVLDLLLSQEGYLGKYSPKNGRPDLPNLGYQQDGQPRLFFANPDLLWAASWHQPRLGSGGFRAAFEGLWSAVTNGARLEMTVGGKPSQETFAFAEDMLVKHRVELLDKAGSAPPSDGGLKRVYMVGDNPASDILGANTFRSGRGTKWTSMLVRSGVYAGEDAPTDDYVPKVLVDDVWDAVQWALDKEGH